MAIEVSNLGGPYLPGRRLWTVAEFERAAELGLFGPDERLELIEGEIVQKMTQNSPHATAIRLAEVALRRIFPIGYDVRSQLPIVLGRRSRPEPDVSVVIGSPRDYAQSHPTTAVLLVEVSDTTLVMDRTTKASLYARAGIAEYWIVNLNDLVLEVHRDPAAMAAQPLGHHYRSITRHIPTDLVSPLAAPAAAITVADLLP